MNAADIAAIATAAVSIIGAVSALVAAIKANGKANTAVANVKAVTQNDKPDNA